MKKLFLLSMMPLAGVMIGSAQTTANGDTNPIPFSLHEVTVTAERDSLQNLYSTRQVFSIPKKFISFSNCRSTAELLAETGKVAVQKSQQGGGSPMLRGFEAARVLLVADGVRMNNLIYRNGHLQNSITIDQFIQDGVDVLKGPYSLVYGSDALGGVVAFTSRNPKLAEGDGVEFNGTAAMRYGSVNNEGTTHIDFNIAGKKFASLTSVTYSNFGDLKSGRNRNPFLPKNDEYISCPVYVKPGANGVDEIITNDKTYLQRRSGYVQYDILQKFLYTPTEGESHLFNFQLSNTNNFNRYDRLSVTSVKKGVITPKYAEWYYGPQWRLFASYNYSAINKLGADKFKFTVAYQNVKESRHDRKYNDSLLYHTWERVNQFTVNTDWIKYIDSHDIHAGIDINVGLLKSTANTDNLASGEVLANSTRYPDGNNSMTTAEGFFTHRWRINEKWQMTDGVRLGYANTYSSVEDPTLVPIFGGNSMSRNNFTYSLAWGMNYLPTNGWKLAFNAATAYRVPNIDNTSKLFDSKLGTVILPNPNLKPEKTISADLNITKYIGDYFVWEHVFFGTYLFDAIATGRGTYQGSDKMEYQGVNCDVYTSLNHDKAVIWGYSTTLTFKPTKYFYFSGSYNYTFGRIISGDEHQPLDHIPPMYGRIGVGYNALEGRFNADFYALYNSHKRKSSYNLDGEDNIDYATVLGEDGEGTPAWYTLNVKAQYAVTPKVTLQAGVENILDTEYRTFASGINAPGRNIYGCVRIAF
jgi:hemoglobin/transferrin/lactoferrin receptor protein